MPGDADEAGSGSLPTAAAGLPQWLRGCTGAPCLEQLGDVVRQDILHDLNVRRVGLGEVGLQVKRARELPVPANG